MFLRPLPAPPYVSRADCQNDIESLAARERKDGSGAPDMGGAIVRRQATQYKARVPMPANHAARASFPVWLSPRGRPKGLCQLA
jgi:hypothetical protein